MINDKNNYFSRLYNATMYNDDSGDKISSLLAESRCFLCRQEDTSLAQLENGRIHLWIPKLNWE